MRLIKIAEAVPQDGIPNRNTPFIYQHRLTDTESVSINTGRRANKEYIVRVYRYPELNLFGVIAFYGRIDGTLLMDWKGSSSSRTFSITRAQGMISSKRNDPSKHYRDANSIAPISQSRAPGTDEIRDYQNQNQSIARPQSPTPPDSSITRIPSIRLPPNRIPQINDDHIASITMASPDPDIRPEWVIRVYNMGSFTEEFLTAEWYTTNGRDFRIHPKYLGTDRATAIRMFNILIGYHREQGLQRREDGSLPAEISEQPESVSSELSHFINELNGTGMAKVGQWQFSIQRVSFRRGDWGWEIVETPTPSGIQSRSAFLPDRENYDKESAIRLATEWATERITAMSSQSVTQKSEEVIPPLPPPPPPEEPPSELELEYMYMLNHGKVNSWKKTSQKNMYPKDNKELKSVISYHQNQLEKNDWYRDLGETVGSELKGYFKFIIRSDKEPIQVYNIWWEGLSGDVRITKHDMPNEILEKYKKEVTRMAIEKSLETYKEVMLGYGGR